MEAPAMDMTAALSELVNLKAKIDHENAELSERHDRLREELSNIQFEKENCRRYNCETQQRVYKIKLSNIAKSNKVVPIEEHIRWQKDFLNDLEVRTGEQLGLLHFEKAISSLRDTIDGALTFYSEDSLQYELTKRAEENRNMRVQLTRISAEVEEKGRYIEEKKKAAEAAKLAEIKRREEEEELKKRLEDEKALAEKMKQREEFMQKKSVQPQVQPFRTVSFGNCSPEPSKYFNVAHVSPAGSVSNAASTKSTIDNSVKPTPKATPTLSTFSQLTGW